MKKVLAVALFVTASMLHGCATTNSIPYKASTNNIIAFQQKLQPTGKKVAIGKIAMRTGVEENLLCRLAGPVVVAPGKTLTQYVQDAFQEELFAAQVYLPTSPNVLNGTIEALQFSSVSPASWDISMKISSTTNTAGYSVSVKFPFGTSWDAMSACKNVADAFGPAVQELLKQVVSHPDFATLAK